MDPDRRVSGPMTLRAHMGRSGGAGASRGTRRGGGASGDASMPWDPRPVVYRLDVSLIVLMAFGSSIAAWGCAEDPVAVDAQCSPQLEQDCACPDGTLGVRECGDNGELENCQCDGTARRAQPAPGEGTAAPDTTNGVPGGRAGGDLLPQPMGGGVDQAGSGDSSPFLEAQGGTLGEGSDAGGERTFMVTGGDGSGGGLDHGAGRATGSAMALPGGMAFADGGTGGEEPCAAAAMVCDHETPCCRGLCMDGHCVENQAMDRGGADGIQEPRDPSGGFNGVAEGGFAEPGPPWSGAMSGGGSIDGAGAGAEGGEMQGGSQAHDAVRWDPICRDFAECVVTCFSQECELACASNATRDAIGTYNEIVHCAQAMGCLDVFGVLHRQCVLEDCGGAIEACFGPPSAPIARGANCLGLTTCLDNCHLLDPRCDDLCRQNASSQALVDLAEIEDCRGLRTSACSPNDYYCLLTHCQVEEERCFPPAPIPSGTRTCTDLELCLAECGRVEDRSACRGRCMGFASPGAYNGYLALSGCIAFFGGHILECLVSSGGQHAMCERWACEQEYVRCHLERIDPQRGGLDCLQTQECLESCEAVPRCESGCYDRTTHDDFGSYARLTFCRNHSGCALTDHDCMRASCAYDYGECIGPVDGATSALTCSTLEGCLVNCTDGDSACVEACQGNASPTGQTLYDALAACLQTHDCQPENPSCVNDNCLSERVACDGQ